VQDPLLQKETLQVGQAWKKQEESLQVGRQEEVQESLQETLQEGQVLVGQNPLQEIQVVRQALVPPQRQMRQKVQ